MLDYSRQLRYFYNGWTFCERGRNIAIFRSEFIYNTIMYFETFTDKQIHIKAAGTTAQSTL